MSDKIFLNDNFFDAEEAKVSVFDRGYLFSDGIYELIPYFNYKPFLFDEHYKRLERSLNMIDIENPYSRDEWINRINNLLETCVYKNFSVYIQISRGVPSDLKDGIYREHAATKKYIPSVLMFYSENKGFPKKKPNEEKAIIMEDKRWLQCDVKSISLLYNAYAKTLAHKENAYETILIRDGNVTEGCSSNVFIVKENIIKTCPKSNLILPGISRTHIVNNLIKSTEYELIEKEFSKEELESADEIFVTNSTQCIVSINKINNNTIGTGTCGKITEEIFSQFIKSIN